MQCHNIAAAPACKPCIQHQQAQSYSCWSTPTWKLYVDKNVC